MLNTDELNTSLERTSKTIAADAECMLAISKAIAQSVEDIIINIDENYEFKYGLILKYFELYADKLNNNAKKLKEIITKYNEDVFE